MNINTQKSDFQIYGSRFLVTGGTGSFGKVITEFLLSQGAGFVRVLSRDESKQLELKNKINDSRLELILGDVREIDTIDYSLRDVDYVFHAAAMKHVPASEENPFEYVKTNIIGSHHLLNALRKSTVKTAVFLSTDKAVYPVNAMGMSKSIMEKLVRSNSYLGSVRACITRYGNVIGSRGSVIPYFINSIKSNRTIKVTDWQMSRFLMSLEESVDLVVSAMTSGNHGDLFVRKAASARLDTILHAIELILDKKAHKIELTGIRPGEKIHETLLNLEEMSHATEDKEYFRVPSIVNLEGLNTLKAGPFQEYRSDNSTQLNVNELSEILVNNTEIKKLI